MNARKVEYVSGIVERWGDYPSPCIAIDLLGPRLGNRGSGEMTLARAIELRDRLNVAIERVSA